MASTAVLGDIEVPVPWSPQEIFSSGKKRVYPEGRVCQACGKTVLSRYNGKKKCHSCRQAIKLAKMGE